jgi:hypothetical protein
MLRDAQGGGPGVGQGASGVAIVKFTYILGESPSWQHMGLGGSSSNAGGSKASSPGWLDMNDRAFTEMMMRGPKVENEFEVKGGGKVSGGCTFTLQEDQSLSSAPTNPPLPKMSGQGMRLGFTVEVWARGNIKSEALASRVQSCGEQAIAESEAEAFLWQPIRPISTAYERVLGPTISLWEALCQRPSSKIMRNKIEFDVPSFTAHALAYGVAAKISTLISGNDVRVLQSSNFETKPVREVRLGDVNRGGVLDMSSRGWISRASCRGEPDSVLIFSAPRDISSDDASDSRIHPNPKVVIIRVSKQGLDMMLYCLDSEASSKIVEYVDARCEWAVQRAGLLETGLHHKMGLFMPCLHPGPTAKDGEAVPSARELVSRAGPPRETSSAARGNTAGSKQSAGADESQQSKDGRGGGKGEEGDEEGGMGEEGVGRGEEGKCGLGGCKEALRRGWIQADLLRKCGGDPVAAHVSEQLISDEDAAAANVQVKGSFMGISRKRNRFEISQKWFNSAQTFNILSKP